MSFMRKAGGCDMVRQGEQVERFIYNQNPTICEACTESTMRQDKAFARLCDSGGWSSFCQAVNVVPVRFEATKKDAKGDVDNSYDVIFQTNLKDSTLKQRPGYTLFKGTLASTDAYAPRGQVLLTLVDPKVDQGAPQLMCAVMRNSVRCQTTDQEDNSSMYVYRMLPNMNEQG